MRILIRRAPSMKWAKSTARDLVVIFESLEPSRLRGLRRGLSNRVAGRSRPGAEEIGQGGPRSGTSYITASVSEGGVRKLACPEMHTTVTSSAAMAYGWCWCGRSMIPFTPNTAAL